MTRSTAIATGRGRLFPLLFIVIPACSDPSGSGGITPPEGPPLPPQLSIAGLSTDTTGAVQFLTATATDSGGQTRAGVEVVFSVASPLANADSILVSDLLDVSYRPTVRVLTDARGVARVGVMFGKRAARSPVTVTVPEYDLSAEAIYETLPGNMVRGVALPADTTIAVGSTYRMRVTCFDRNDNVRLAHESRGFCAQIDRLPMEPRDQVIAVDGSGNVTATGPGTATVQVIFATGGSI